MAKGHVVAVYGEHAALLVEQQLAGLVVRDGATPPAQGPKLRYGLLQVGTITYGGIVPLVGLMSDCGQIIVAHRAGGVLQCGHIISLPRAQVGAWS